MKIDGENVTVARDVEGDEETIETTLPLLVTAQQGLNEPRYPSLPGIMKAKKKPLEELELDDLDLDEDDVEAKTKTIEVFLPPEKEAGKILEGELTDQVKELVQLLHKKQKYLNYNTFTMRQEVMIMGRKVLVLGEVSEDKLRNVSFEAIAAAKTIAEDGEVVGVIIGKACRISSERIDTIWCGSCS